jgi:hypothetical protein
MSTTAPLKEMTQTRLTAQPNEPKDPSKTWHPGTTPSGPLVRANLLTELHADLADPGKQGYTRREKTVILNHRGNHPGVA